MNTPSTSQAKTRRGPSGSVLRLVRGLRDEIHETAFRDNVFDGRKGLARKAGRLARLTGVPEGGNPYVPGYWQYDEWKRGWNHPNAERMDAAND